ncbi:carbon monoxide dehydrogenase [Pandoraea terrae]|uniref:Carbon monoxide dehydrogenase n=1 Tax=Pandoraea terrae TaxID=1537710 RepID=A0A5E4TPJ3_9BURK|nr:molybdopterin cofactor-binding domain-containing protein [Pandoraea terrae]VVD88504.1 carbon monoxide dehydrogenase [Pandoraea terrae]
MEPTNLNTSPGAAGMTPASRERRRFIKLTAGAGGALVLGCVIPIGRWQAMAQGAEAAKPFPPNAFLRIAPNDIVTIQVSKLDFGQGTLTSLPMLLAEELDCPWDNVRAELAPGEDVYRDPIYHLQFVGGSTSIANTFTQYRELGARARAMLIAAAAQRWHVAPSACATSKGVVTGPSGQRLRYGALAAEAMRLPLPEHVELKDPSKFRLIGRATTRLDTAAKSSGHQHFSIDVDVPGMKTAVVARAPVWGAKVARLDDSASKAMPGVRAVFRIPGDRGGESVVCVADGYWQAKRARGALVVTWDDRGIERVDSAKAFERYRALAATPGTPAQRADTSSLARAPNVIDAVYEFPYLAHVPMEPLNMSLQYTGAACTVWAGSQFQSPDREAIAKTLQLPVEKVRFNTVMAGGGFGRRAVSTAANAIEAAHIARAMQGTPVKVMWSREDDVRGGYYRPMHVHRVKVGFDAHGKIAAWDHVIVGQSILTGTMFEPMLVKDGVDDTMVEGARGSQYAIPNMAISVHNVVANVPVLWFRSVGNSHTAYVIETMVDEIAVASGRDPVEFRRELLQGGNARSREALDLAVAKSGYGVRALPAGQAWGVAVHFCFDSAVAYVAEVSIADGRPKVHRVTAAVHCNLPVNPRTIEAQAMGGLVFGLSMGLPGFEITLKDGVVQQSNFADYTPAYMADVPHVEVHVCPSAAPPTGIGEVGVPPIAPAVANAVAALTRQRMRRLPFPTLNTA